MPIAAGDIVTYNGTLWVNQPAVQGPFGVGPTSPNKQLHVRKTSADATIKIENTGHNKASTLLFSRESSAGTDKGAAYLRVKSDTGGTVSLFEIGTGADIDETSSATKVSITQAGKVGIGVTSPIYKVEVEGSDNDLTSGSIRAKNTADGSASGALVGVVSGSSNTASGYLGAFSNSHASAFFADRVVVAANSDAAGISLVAGNSGQDIRFVTGVPTTERMRIEADGDVGVGTTSPHTLLHVAGPLATAFVEKTSNYTAGAGDSVIALNAGSGNVTITLPTAVGIAGRQYTIKRIDSSGNTATVATTSSQTIDGAATKSLTAQWKYVTVVSDGANWLVISDN
jgi:hypothetical protein